MTTQVLETRNDNRLYYVSRHGHIIKRTWNELSATEKVQQIEAENRAYYETLFNIY